MKSPFIAALALFALAALHADETADRDAVAARAKVMIDSTMKGDMTVVLKYMPASVVQAMGGEDVLKKAIGGVAEQFKASGMEIVSVEVQPPAKFHRNAGKTFALVKSKTVIQIPGKTRITEESSMLAIQDAPGADWTFLRVNQPLASNREILKKLLPEIPDDLVVEPPARPVVEPITK